MQQDDGAATALSIGHPSDQFGRIGLVEHDALDGQVRRLRQRLPRPAGDRLRTDMPVEDAAGSDHTDQREREPNAKPH